VITSDLFASLLIHTHIRKELNDMDALRSRLSVDIHTAASIMFFILTGGLHAYGPPTQTPETVHSDWLDRTRATRSL
jgi:hypothetical protein